MDLVVVAIASTYRWDRVLLLPIKNSSPFDQCRPVARIWRVSERAQEIADANYFTLQINPEAIFEDGQSTGSIEIVNPGTNVYPIAVDISLLSSGEVIYSSGAIYPNQFVENVALATPLAKGEYPAKATINIYDPESKEKQGVTEAELTIIVKN